MLLQLLAKGKGIIYGYKRTMENRAIKSTAAFSLSDLILVLWRSVQQFLIYTFASHVCCAENSNQNGLIKYVSIAVGPTFC